MHDNCGDSCPNIDILYNILWTKIDKDILSIFIKYLICNKCHTFLFNNKCQCPQIICQIL